MAGHRRAVLLLDEGADIGAQDFGQHRDDAVGEIDRIAALPRLSVERAAGAHVIGHVGNGDDSLVAAVSVRLRPDRIVVVARIGGVDGDDGDIAQIFALVFRQGQIDRTLRLGHRRFGKDVRNAVLGDGDEAEAFGRKRIADHLDHFHARARRFAGAFGENEFALLRAAEIGNRRGIADALVHGGEPGLAAAVELDDAHQAFAAGGELLDRRGAPAALGLLVARENAIAALERRHLLRIFDEQARRLFVAIRTPVLGLGEDIAVVDLDHLENGYLRYAAHPVIGRALAIDQAFLGHVLQALLERDLLLPFETERLGDLTLSSGGLGGLDEFENLVFAGHARCLLGGLPVIVLFCHGLDMGQVGAFSHPCPTWRTTALSTLAPARSARPQDRR